MSSKQARPMIAVLAVSNSTSRCQGNMRRNPPMPEQALTIIIKSAEASQLEVLEHEFSPDTLSKPHHRRYEVQQRGEGFYLIAWHNHTPVARFLLCRSGPDDARVKQHIDVGQSAFLEAGATRVRCRR